MTLLLAGIVAAVIGFAAGWISYGMGRRDGFTQGWNAHKSQQVNAVMDSMIFGTSYVTEDPNLYRKIHGR